jgi:hypothetical protein
LSLAEIVQIEFAPPYVIGLGEQKTETVGVALLIVRVVEELTGLLLLSPPYATPMVYVPAFQPENPPAEVVPPLKEVVVHAPPLMVHVTVPVAPPLRVAVQVVVSDP